MSVCNGIEPFACTTSLSWLGGISVMTLDLQSKAREFNSRLGCCRVVTGMGDCLWTDKPSQ